MKPCPYCKSTNIISISSSNLGHWMSCGACTMTSPIKSSAAEAEAAWDSLPRDTDIPPDTSLTLQVGKDTYTVLFAHSGRDTLCWVSWRDHGERCQVAGLARCSASDTFDPAIGERFAMRRACGIEDGAGSWRHMKALWHVYRLYVREQKEAALQAA